MRPDRTHVTTLFREAFGKDPARLAVVPGRVELLGNHTDYNAGLVLAATIDRTLQLALAPRSDGRVSLVSSAFPGRRVEFDARRPGRGPDGCWSGYVRAVLIGCRAAGVAVGGFDAAVHSDIPVGGGLSSSAALLVATALAAASMPHRTAAERMRVAGVCQRAERRTGVDCGLLDYLTILHGRAGCALRLDLRSLTVRALPWPDEVALVLADSGVRHRLTEGGYNAIRRACEGAARKIGVPTLREARVSATAANGLRLTARESAAARHIIEENLRVAAATTAIRSGDGVRLGALCTASHESSRTQLRNSCPELDRLVSLASTVPGWLGGRLTGGGFGGMTVHLVGRRASGRFIAALPPESASTRCGLGGGATRIEL